MSKLAATFSRAGIRALLLLLLAARAHGFDIDNTASAIFFDGGNGPIARASNTVRVTTAPPPQLEFFGSSSFAVPARVARLGDPLFLEARAPGCNVLPTVVETRTIVITSSPSGDAEDYVATETGPNTGVFRVPNVATRNVAVAGVTPQNVIVEAGKNETLTATLLGCGSAQTITNLLIDPSGVVFSTLDNRPVPNAVVELFVASGSACTNTRATVQRVANGVIGPAPNRVTTGTDGRFEFPLVPPGSYCLRVAAPSGFIYPSLVTAETLRTFINPARQILGSGTSGGSYGAPFDVTPVTGPVIVDVPLDGSVAPPPAGTLMLEKSAVTQIVEIGEFVDYRIAVKNQTGQVLSNVAVIDVLPAGFAYERSSARFANARIGDPSGARGPRLEFALPDLAASDEVIYLTYRARTGPGTIPGEATNRAQGSARAAGIALVSNTASAKVRVLGGVFGDRGFVVGKVFLDCNRDRVQGNEELGVPGVRLLMEDGSFVITDAEGKYSFYGVSPRTHVLKVDGTTMPRGSEMINLSNRNAGDASSRFIDLKKGELHKANFAEGSCNRQVLAEVKARRLRADTLVDELAREVRVRVTADGKPEAVADVKALPASGVIGSGRDQAPLDQFTSVRPQSFEESAYNPSLPNARVREAISAKVSNATVGGTAQIDLEKVLAQADSALAFLDLKDGDVLAYAQTSVRVKGAEAAQIKLSVNGVEVSEARVGKTTRIADRGLQGKEYIGIALTAGKNSVVLTQVDSFGNERGRQEITVVAPDRLGKLEITPDGKDAVADGVTPVKISVRLTDANGVPVTVRTPVTLESTLGRFDIDDLSRSEPGIQTFVSGGGGQFLLIPPQEPGEAILRATSGALSAEARTYFLPDLRPMVAAGVIEGVLNLRKLNTKALVPSRQQDGFEQELKAFASESADGRHAAAARAAFFLKGKIRGEYLLTLGYDSDKDTRERLFRDIQPDEFYPVYGDSSIRGFDAQSTSRLYVRVDKQRSYLLYGDFTTNAATEARKLSNYSRSLTGVKEHFENGRVSLNAFASKDASRQVVDEIRAEGISGPYRLSTAKALANSEKVEIITRDRNQSGVVLKSEPQTRFADYAVDLEPISGAIRLVFKSPVPSLDANLNPIFIRVTYEVDQGGKEFWVAGADAQLKLNEHLEIGATAVTDRNPDDRASLLGANATLKLGEKTYLSGEVARSDKQSLGSGDAARVELRHEGDKLKANVYAGRTQEAFENPGAWLSQGRVEAGIKAAYQLDQRTRLIGEAIHTEDTKIDGERDGILLALERAINDHVRVEVGARHARETLASSQQSSSFVASNEVDSLRLKVAVQPPAWPKATLYGEVEQDVRDSDKRVLAVGGEYQIADRARAYARHEFVSSINGAFALNNTQRQNTTIFGVDTDYMKDGHLFSEYRARDAVSGRDAEAAVGLRNMWDLGKGLRLNTNFERVHPVAGADSNKSTALAVGMDYVGAETWKGSARVEVRDGSSSDSLLNTLGAAIKLDRNWTFLGRNIVSVTREEAGGERIQERLQLGMAYRPVDADVWNALAKIELRHEKDDTQQVAGAQEKFALRRSTQILSLHGNYQPRKPLILSGRIAAKWTQDRSNGLESKYNAQLISGRMILELSNRWDLSIQASSHFSNGFKAHQYGLGVEAGYLLTENLWLAGGYNFFGFEDQDLVDGDYTNPGWYARLRYKFDETLFGASDPRVNHTLSPNEN